MTQNPTTKPQLRAHLRQALTAIPPADRAERSAKACDNAAALPLFTAATTILTYLTAADAHHPNQPAELDTARLNRLATDAGKALAAPHIDWAARTMSPRLLTPDFPPAVRRHAIPEPPEAAPLIPLEDIDLVIVPALAFDRHRNRLGRGAGFYDRFLHAAADLPNPPATLGLAFHEQLLNRLPTDPHDQPVNALATDQTTITAP